MSAQSTPVYEGSPLQLPSEKSALLPYGPSKLETTDLEALSSLHIRD